MRFWWSVLAIGLGLYVSAGAYTQSGTLTADETWGPAVADTIMLLGDISVRNNRTLTILPGTVIRGYTLDSTDITRQIIYVKGSGVISAVGTGAQPVFFMNVYVEFDSISRDSLNRVAYCNFSAAWGNGLIEFRDVHEGVEYSKIIIDHCNFTSDLSSTQLIYITSGAAPTFSYCAFTGARSGVFSHGCGNVTFNYCTFSNQSVGVVCGGMGGTQMPWEPLTMRINHCTFYNINGRRFTSVTSANGYGVCTVNYPGTLEVKNTIFDQIDSSGIRELNREDAHFVGRYWTVLEDYNCYGTMRNDPVRPLAPLPNGLTLGAHSLEVAPQMINPANGDFSLAIGSPCRNTADDGTNLGTWQAGTGMADVSGVSDQDFPGIRVSSHVLRTTVDITFRQPLDAAVLVYNTAGAVVCNLGSPQQAEKLVWNGTNARGQNVPAGMYYVVARTGAGQAVEKIVKLR